MQGWIDKQWSDFTKAEQYTMRDAAGAFAMLGFSLDSDDDADQTQKAEERWTPADYTGASLSFERPPRRAAPVRAEQRAAARKGAVHIKKGEWPARQAAAAGSCCQRHVAKTLGRLRRLHWLESHGRSIASEAKELRLRIDQA